MKVLVTGGAGFIGSHVVDLLIERGHEPYVIDNMTTGRAGNITIDIDHTDIRDTDGLGQCACDVRPDAIIHLAAQPSLRASLDDPAHDALINIVGTLNVLAAAKASKAHVVFASTSAVYAGSDSPMIEDHFKFPRTPYGLAKLTAERYIELSGISSTILRFGNVYGPRQVQVGENQLIPHCLAHILNGRPFAIHGDGEQARDFVYVSDIARACVLSAERQPRGVFNAGTGTGVSVNSVCERLAWLCDWRGTFAHDDAKTGDARHIALDSRRAAERFGWKAETLLDDGLKATVGWWKERA